MNSKLLLGGNECLLYPEGYDDDAEEKAETRHLNDHVSSIEANLGFGTAAGFSSISRIFRILIQIYQLLKQPFCHFWFLI
jgi:hypothetical protein